MNETSFSRAAVQARPNDYNSFGILAAAEYRSGRWTESLAAAERSLTLRAAAERSAALRKGDNADVIFMKALAHWRRGEKEKASALFDAAADLAKRYPNSDAAIVRQLWIEAASLLGKPRPLEAGTKSPPP